MYILQKESCWTFIAIRLPTPILLVMHFYLAAIIPTVLQLVIRKEKLTISRRNRRVFGSYDAGLIDKLK